jgi:hypothetical protein
MKLVETNDPRSSNPHLAPNKRMKVVYTNGQAVQNWTCCCPDERCEHPSFEFNTTRKTWYRLVD